MIRQFGIRTELLDRKLLPKNQALPARGVTRYDKLTEAFLGSVCLAILLTLRLT
jgi:hypothetical protein